MTPCTVIEFPDGFRLEAAGLSPVTVRLDPWSLKVHGRYSVPRRFGLYEGRSILKRIAHELASDRSLLESWPGVVRGPGSESAVRRVEHAIRPLVESQQRRLAARVDPLVLQVQHAIFHATGCGSVLAQDPRLYDEPWSVRDVLQHRAAAIALAWCGGDLRDAARGGWVPIEADVAGVVQKKLRRRGEPPPSVRDADDFTESIEAMADWRALFSPTCEPYASLDRTLMTLPRRVPARLVCELRGIRLSRSVRSAVELTFLLAGLGYMRSVVGLDILDLEAFERRHGLAALFHGAAAEEICRALDRVGAQIGRRMTADRPSDLEFLAAYLADYPEVHRGRLGGLAARAIRWHRTDRTRVLLGFGVADRTAAVPTLPLPEIEGVRPLATVGDIVDEGERMHHCVAGRVAAALNGRAFLFHVERDGEHATVEISADRTVLQATGPRNTHNGAAVWGKNILASLARGAQISGGVP